VADFFGVLCSRRARSRLSLSILLSIVSAG
jgi:hypothetical protein